MRGGYNISNAVVRLSEMRVWLRWDAKQYIVDYRWPEYDSECPCNRDAQENQEERWEESRVTKHATSGCLFHRCYDAGA